MQQPDQPETIDFLLATVCHLHRVRIQQLFEALGLYQGQPPVLRMLWEQEGLAQSELAARLNIAPATMTKMLQRMEKAGFILRKADAQDQRVMRVYLADKGRAVQREAENVFRTLEAETFANLAGAERDVLRGFLLQMRSNLLAATGEDQDKKQEAK